MPAFENNQRLSNSRGGARAGAGRKLGSITRRTREVAEAAAKEGLTPLEYMLELLRDENEERAVRLDAAKSAAPYVHAKLAAIQVEGQIDGTVSHIIDEGAAKAALERVDLLIGALAGGSSATQVRALSG